MLPVKGNTCYGKVDEFDNGEGDWGEYIEQLGPQETCHRGTNHSQEE